jgi:pimeloyl-ACP methyl ester carboxylesterase
MFPSPAGRMAVGLLAGLVLAGCQSLPPPSAPSFAARLDESIRVLASPQSSAQQRARAVADYRDLVADRLPELLQEAAGPSLDPAMKGAPGFYTPASFADIAPVARAQVTTPGLHRAGLGLPAVGRIAPDSPNAPLAGFSVPLTLLALPNDSPTACCKAALVDPTRIQAVRTGYGDLPVAMDLEAPLDATTATGPRLGAGLVNLLRPGRFTGRPRIVFLQPFDPDKRPLVLVHGLMSTPRMWAPLVKDLLADEQIRSRFQLWFFYYPTGQPVPLSALQLREALDDAASTYRLRRPMILVGHSMGGILSRAQVSRVSLDDAKTMFPDVASLPDDSPVRRALVFEPRADVDRVVFLFTPHRGSRLATNSIGAWGIRLIRLPDWVLGELTASLEEIYGVTGGRLPTSIHSLSPHSQFLRVLDQAKPAVPAHSIIGDRGRGDLAAGSDGVVAYTSAHLASAESEVVVPAGHGGFAHPLALQELRRILHKALADEQAPAKAQQGLRRPAAARRGSDQRLP